VGDVTSDSDCFLPMDMLRRRASIAGRGASDPFGGSGEDNDRPGADGASPVGEDLAGTPSEPSGGGSSRVVTITRHGIPHKVRVTRVRQGGHDSSHLRALAVISVPAAQPEPSESDDDSTTTDTPLTPNRRSTWLCDVPDTTAVGGGGCVGNSTFSGTLGSGAWASDRFASLSANCSFAGSCRLSKHMPLHAAAEAL
jgi:hypothetical protein